MPTILDYLATEFAPFEEKPFNPVDSLVLSQFCMVRVGGLVPPLKDHLTLRDRSRLLARRILPSRSTGLRFKDALLAERYADMFTGLDPHLVKEALLALAASPRFRQMTVQNHLSLFDAQRQTQFAAMTFVYKNQFAYIGFRGTDSSFTGWRENFNMAFTSPVPAQDQARRYVNLVAPRLQGGLILGGHSKGGNLAIYAGITADSAAQARIDRIYCHDGPGFKPGAFGEDGYARVKDRLHKTVPQDSLVGMLMERRAHYRVVKSSARGGKAQHSAFTWEVKGDDFVYLDGLSEGAQLTAQVLNDWIARFSDDELRVIVDAIFKAVEASGAEDASEVFDFGPKTIALLTQASLHVDGETRGILAKAIAALSDTALKRVGRALPTLKAPWQKPR